MSRRLTPATLILLLPCLVYGAPIPKSRTQPAEPYYPTKAGTKLVYKDGAGVEFTEVVTEVSEQDGAKVVTIGKQEGGKVTRLRQVTVSDASIVQTHDGNGKLELPACFLKLPVKRGDTWEANVMDQGKTWLVGTRTVSAEEEVVVPAGKFKAIRIDWDCEIVKSTQKYTITTWYASGVGEIKRVSGSSERVLVSVVTEK
jgi:hypothetical protein